ncbi:DHA2 family efflux MFS transporter permease subunit [uncultured Rikenella sp.]|uniref:DHA2 family efflux MFS transporter permease subunit n=1 Tax=uncultured Rikenella sp. TaxID=368003 RepID=UPI00262B467B|nr:DHA2 family efflux MFS transporter permease subunit [uncultured Rikenella sp.]
MKAFLTRFRAGKSYKWWVLGVIMLGTFMAVLDITVVNVGMPAIMSSFHVGISTAEWVVTAYMITMTIMLPTAGWLADRYGNKKVYIIGICLFTLGSWLCGRAWTDGFLVGSRALQGVGSGMIQALGLAIVSREFPPEQRGTALGLWAVASAASISFGPLIGGYLVDDFNWHWIFDVNVPLGLLAIAASLIIQREWKNTTIGRFDWIGFLSVALFMPLCIYALARGNAATNPKGWAAPEVIGSFAIGGVALIVFIWHELRTKAPLLNIRLLGDRNFGVAMLVLMIFGIGMLGGTYLLPLYMQNGLGYTAIMAGMVFLPVGLIQGTLSAASGIVTRYIGSVPLMIVGIVVMTLSFWFASRFTAETHHSAIMTVLYLRGFGMGLTFAPLNIFSLKYLAQKDMAAASGIANSIKQLSGSIGIALLTAIMTSRISYYTAAKDAAESKTVAYIAGVADDFFIVAVLTLLAMTPLLLLLIPRKNRTPRPE